MNIVVTGAANGIGCRLVTLLAREGHAVMATDVDFASLRASATEFYWPDSVVTAQQDVASPRAWAELAAFAVERFGTLDALVNVAGVIRVEPVHELTPESVALQIDANTKGVILGTQAAASVMVRQGYGHVINVASLAGVAPIPGISVYSASKFAVRGFSLAAAQELDPLGVRVSVVCPDLVDTRMVDDQLDHAGAALTFSGRRMLTTDVVARTIIELLARPKLEVCIPRSRGFLAKTSMLMPRFLNRWIVGRLTRIGLARQEKIRKTRTAAESR